MIERQTENQWRRFW